MSQQSAPDSWGFDPEFLADPSFLPPFVAAIDLPALAPSRRAVAADLRARFRPADGIDAAACLAAHTAILPEVHAIHTDRERDRNLLLGPVLLQLHEDLLNRHMLFVGPPGTGKTTQGLLPLTASLVADRNRTVIVFDPKGDQFPVLEELARRAGRPARSVLLLNLTDPAASIGWNPVRRGLTRTEAHGIATAIANSGEPRTSGDSVFWKNSSIELITHALLGLAADPEETPTLPRLCEILDLPRQQLLAWLRTHGCHKFAAFLESGSHNAETCLVDTSMRLVSLLDEDLCAVMSHAELQLASLFVKPTVLVVEMAESRIDRMRGIFNVLVQQILDRGIEAASRFPDARLRFPVSIVIDEFGSAIGAVPRLPTYLNTVRSRRISIVAAVQSVAQIHGLYGSEAGAVMVGFSSKIFFANVERADAVLASDLCGTMSVRLTAPDGSPGPLLARPVYLPEEIARPMEHPVLGRPVLMVLADLAPVQVYLVPAYRLPGLRELLLGQRRSRRRPRRRQPLTYVQRACPVPPATGPAAKGVATGLPPGISNTHGWSADQLARRLEEVKGKLEWAKTTGSAAKWWEAFERENHARMPLVLRLAEELLLRSATVTEFFLAYVYSNTDNIQANLHYLDYTRLKKEEERKKREAAAKSAENNGGTAAAG